MLQFDLRALKPGALCLRQGFAGAVDIEGQHRKRRTIGAAFAARTVLRRTLQRRRNLLRARQFEDALLEIERVAFLCHALRPAFRGSSLARRSGLSAIGLSCRFAGCCLAAISHRQLLMVSPENDGTSVRFLPGKCGNPRSTRALSGVRASCLPQTWE